MKARGAKMKTSGIKFLVLAAVFMMVLAGVAQGFTINSNQTLSMKIESNFGYDAFSVYWGLDAWQGTLTLRLLSDTGEMLVAPWSPIQNSYGSVEDHWRSDFVKGSFGYAGFNGEFLTLEFLVSDGSSDFFSFLDKTYNTDEDIFEDGPFASSFYTDIFSVNWSNRQVDDIQSTIVYSNISQNGNTFTAAPVPEPATLILLTSGMVGLVLYRKRKKPVSRVQDHG